MAADWEVPADVTVGDHIDEDEWNELLGTDGGLRYLYDVLKNGEAWFPVDSGTGSDGNIGHHLSGAGENCGITGVIPADLASVTSIEVIVLPDATDGAADWDLTLYLGADGEAYDTHEESNNASTYDVTDNQWFSVDLSSIDDNLAAGDRFYCKFTQTGGTENVYVIGILLKYTRY